MNLEQGLEEQGEGAGSNEPRHFIRSEALCLPGVSQQLCPLDAERASVSLQLLLAELRAKI
jgi:hypothetical protein